MKPIFMIWTLAAVLCTSVKSYSQTVCDTAIAGVDINMSLSANCRLDLAASFLVVNPLLPDSFYTIIVLDENGDTVLQPLTEQHIGEKLKILISLQDTCPDLGVAWSFLTLEDKVDPVLICVSDTIECVDFFFREPFVDDCQDYELQIISQTFDTLCADSLTSRVTRTYRVTDASGNESECTEELVIKRFDVCNDVEWPVDVQIACDTIQFFLDGDGMLLPPPLDLPTGSGAQLAIYPFGVPTASGASLFGFNFKECGVRAFYEDLKPIDTGCGIKYMREWTVYEWHCDEELQKSMLQIIEVIDTTAPVFSFNQDTFYFYSGIETCEVDIPLTALGINGPTDNCSDLADLEVDIVIPNYGNLDNLNDTIENVGLDTLEVRFNISDKCHKNTASDTIFIIVLDTIGPVPICLDSTVVVLADSIETKVPATTYNLGSYDVCGGPISIKARRMEDMVSQDSVSFTCDDEGQDVMVVVEYTDQFGNKTICMVSTFVDGSGVNCPSTMSGQPLVLSGFVSYEDRLGMANIPVRVKGNKTTIVQTDSEGYFEYDIQEGEESLYLLPEKDDNHAAGITTFDIVLMQRHLLGLDDLDSPYQLIAADVNGNGRLNASDLYEMRRLILADSERFPASDSYVFIPSDMTFVDPSDPWDNGELFGMRVNLSGSITPIDFMGIKVGDVNRSILNSSTRSSTEIVWEYAWNEEGTNEVVIEIYAVGQESLSGFQSSLSFDNETIEFVGFESEQLDISNDQYSTKYLMDGVLPISWSDAVVKEISGDKPLFKIRFRKTLNYRKSTVGFISSPVISETYMEDSPYFLSLSERQGSDPERFVLLPNSPNPWSNYTNISFVLPASDEVSIRIYDLSMRVIYDRHQLRNVGQNTVQIEQTDLNGPGVYIYEIIYRGESLIKKMINIR